MRSGRGRSASDSRPAGTLTMLRRWISGGFLLFFALALRIAYTDWLAGFLLAFLLLLPPAGVLVSLPAVLSAKVTLICNPDVVSQGARAGWTLEAKSALGLPLGRVRIKVQIKSRLTGETTTHRETFFLPASGVRQSRGGETTHCGLFEGEIVSAWATDALGLFWLPLKRGKNIPACQLVLPAEGAAFPDLPKEEAAGMRPRPGGGPGEDYEPREYRPGDPLSTIHWKLSAKRDSLIVRETLEDVRKRPVLTFDHFGTAETLDKTFALLRGTGNRLLQANRSFDVAWVQAESGDLRRFSVSDEKTFQTCLAAALSEPAPLTGCSVLDAPRLSGGIYLKPGEEAVQ